MTSLFMSNVGLKMLRFRKLTLENLKNWETFPYLNNFKFSKVVCSKSSLKVRLIRNKKIFAEGIYPMVGIYPLIR